MQGFRRSGRTAAAWQRWIRHGENGFLIPVGDSDALAERLDELLADDAKRSAFGAQAKRDAEATFLAEQMTRKIEKLYLEAGK